MENNEEEEAEIEDKSMGEIIEEWDAKQRQKGIGYSWEGTTGVRKLEKFCADLGYRTGNFVGDVPILNFLADNPGAIEAILNWVEEQENKEWKENLS